MAQPSNKILTEANLAKSDYRDQFVEVVTSPNDYATGDSSLILSTVPFLPEGDIFVDTPVYPIGLTQNFNWSEGLNGNFVPEIGSTRKVNTAGTASGSGSISKLIFHGNSLLASLFRPTFFFMSAVPELAAIRDKLMTSSSNQDWIKALAIQELDLFGAELGDAVDRVVAPGGMNALMYKLPFGLIELKRDAKQRVLAINYFEQCAIRGNQGGVAAGQFQQSDSISFDFERMRPLTTIGIFSLSADSAQGMKIPD